MDTNVIGRMKKFDGMSRMIGILVQDKEGILSIL